MGVGGIIIIYIYRNHTHFTGGDEQGNSKIGAPF
jgi:hypothetical protein